MAVMNVHPEAITQLWGQVLQAVRGRLGSQQAFDTWFRPIVPRHLSPEIVDLEVPNAFFVDWIHEHHLSALRQSCAEVLGSLPDIRFSAREQDALETLVAPEPPPLAPTPIVPAPPARASGGSLNPRLTFDSFVVGSGNRFTHAACLAVAENPGRVYNPLFIFGGSGLGKTHLLQAVGHATLRSRPGARVAYVSAERFMNEMIYSIQHAQMLSFRNKYRNMDVLLIDDIQFLAGKESTQEEFFYTFNALSDARKQVVVTSDKPPKDIVNLEERLTSRFNQGLVSDVQPPDLETRTAILRNRCAVEGEGDRVPPDVLLLIADRIRNNIRDLEGCLVRLLAVASLVHRDITIELAEEVIHQYVDPEPDHLTPERIIAVVCERFGVRSEAMCGERRTKTIAMPRQVAMYLMRQLTDLSLAEIGRLFGGRDHTTVLHAGDKVGRLIASDSAWADKVNGLISTLMS